MPGSAGESGSERAVITGELTGRRRSRETLLFGRPDRVPLVPGSGRRSTLERWRREGLPKDLPPGKVAECAYRQAGGALPWPAPDLSFPINERMIPTFEERVVERRERTQIVQDWKGNICEISNDYTLEYLRDAIDFVTRRWIKCPVETREDWLDMRRRYRPDDPARLPEDPAAAGRACTEARGFVQVHFSGPFWQLREWCGFENLCMFFYDQAALVEEMLEFWKEYVARLLEIVFRYTIPDAVHISEDMAYKNFSMISPEMVRRHLLPVYRRWGDLIRGAGVPIYAMDSDGYIGELIPIWIEAGINVCDPVEAAAGNDLVKYRREFGRDMAYRGGVDKRAIASGGRAIRNEIRRLEPVIRDGGYIPSCDHGVPSDVSWPNFVHYTGLLARATGWL